MTIGSPSGAALPTPGPADEMTTSRIRTVAAEGSTVAVTRGNAGASVVAVTRVAPATIRPTEAVISDARIPVGSTAGATVAVPTSAAVRASAAGSSVRTPATGVVTPAASAAAATHPSAVVSSGGTSPRIVAVPPAEADRAIGADSSAPRAPVNAAASNAGVIPESGATTREADSAPVASPPRAADPIVAIPVVDSPVAGTIPAIEAMPAAMNRASVAGSSVVAIPATVVKRGGAARPDSSAAMTIDVARDRIARGGAAARIAGIGHRVTTLHRIAAVAAKEPMPVGAVPSTVVRRGRRNPICRTRCRQPISIPLCGGTCSVWTRTTRRRLPGTW